MTELSGLLQPDGSVRVPPELAYDVLRRLGRDVVNEARGTGGLPSVGARKLLDALYEAAQRHAVHVNSALVVEAAEGLSVREVAERMGCSPQHVRQQLAEGRLSGRKSGGVWIVHFGPRLATSQAPQRIT